MHHRSASEQRRRPVSSGMAGVVGSVAAAHGVAGSTREGGGVLGPAPAAVPGLKAPFNKIRLALAASRMKKAVVQ
jgi:hypothetical protein